MKDLGVTVWVTNDCNLLCDYCYVHKRIDYMSMQTAEAVVDFIIKKKEELKPNRIKVVFSGGEPLLNFCIVKKIVSSLSCIEKEVQIVYMITTNGTIYPTDEQINYLKRMSVSISIDGKKEWNDLARKYKNSDKGSYEAAVKTLNKMIEHDIPIRIRMTITPDNVGAFAQNYKALYQITRQLIAFEPNISDERWNMENLDKLFDNLEEIILFMEEKSKKQTQVMLQALKDRFFHARSECSGGKNSFHISATGKIYPCILATEVKEYELGDVYKGINFDKLCEFQKINEKETEDCRGCAFYNNCESKSCKQVNKYYSGSYDTPSVVKCNIQNRMYKLLMEYKSSLEDKEDANK